MSNSDKGLKLIIQVPCLNEAETLGETLSALPREVDGFACVEWVIIDDGSSDGTAEVAISHGADHVVRIPTNQGLAVAFMKGIKHSLLLGADVIVNTDADNQYDATCIPELVAPILSGESLFVIGERPIDEIGDFSLIKKVLQKLGSWVVRVASRTAIPDAPSGFRAIHRDAAIQLVVVNSYTYTLETIIQAGHRGIPISSVPVKVNRVARPSRLVSSVPKYVYKSLLTIVRIFVIYKPLRFFMVAASLPLLAGLSAFARFLFHFASGEGGGNVQSLILGTALFLLGALLIAVGVVSDLLAFNRRMLEDIRVQVWEQRLAADERASGTEFNEVQIWNKAT